MRSSDIPKVVIQRLPLYLRCVRHFQAQGKTVVSSQEIAANLGLTPAQIRKDLSCFGEFGKQGVGYDVQHLASQLERILHVDRTWPAVLVGAGDLGHALIRFSGFEKRGFRIIAAFDRDPQKIGQRVGPLVIQPMAALATTIREAGVRIAIIAVPAEEAQQVAEQLASAGIRAILNYAPVSLNLPPEVQVYYVDPVIGLQSMTYYLGDGTPQGDEDAGEAP